MKSTNNINVVLTNEHVESGFKSLEVNGLNIFHFPMIRTKPISNITKIDLDQIDCIIFVSKNGVKYFFENSNSKKFNLSEKFFICIGEKTSKKLNEMGYDPSYTCSRNYAADMFKELKKNNILISKNSLLIQGNLSNPSLYNSLSKYCKIQRKVYYETIKTVDENKEINVLASKSKPYVIFTSPSAFDAFSEIYDPNNFFIISIGKTTSATICDRGYKPELTSKMQSYEGISKSFLKFLKSYNYEIS